MGSLLQGYTEQSNVNVVEEFINLIVSQGAYGRKWHEMAGFRDFDPENTG